MKGSIAKINEHIRKIYPNLDIEFVKGEGYFYFAGEDGFVLDIPSIYVCNFKDMEYSDWVEIVFISIDEAIAAQAA